MTKTNKYPVPSGRDLMLNIEYSPYYRIALKMLKKRNKYNPMSPYFLADIYDCFHEIAKIDNKINKGIKNG